MSPLTSEPTGLDRSARCKSNMPRRIAPLIPHGQVAQSVEQGTENPRVGSSILSLATFRIKDLRPVLESFIFALRDFCGT